MARVAEAFTEGNQPPTHHPGRVAEICAQLARNLPQERHETVTKLRRSETAETARIPRAELPGWQQDRLDTRPPAGFRLDARGPQIIPRQRRATATLPAGCPTARRLRPDSWLASRSDWIPGRLQAPVGFPADRGLRLEVPPSSAEVPQAPARAATSSAEVLLAQRGRLNTPRVLRDLGQQRALLEAPARLRANPVLVFQ